MVAGAAAAGGLTVSGDGVEVAAGVAASAADGMTVSEGELTVAAGAVTAAACVAECLRPWVEGLVA